MKRLVGSLLFILLNAVTLFAGCIDVGHDAQIGCLVDNTEPGCPGSDAGAGAGGDMPSSVTGGDAGPDADAAGMDGDAAGMDGDAAEMDDGDAAGMMDG